MTQSSKFLRPLVVPAGTCADSILPQLEEMLSGRGPALLPVPEEDGVRAALLRTHLHAGDLISEQAALVVATSGSTGRPRGAVHSVKTLSASIAATHERLGGAGSWLLALPAHHIAGLQVLLRSIIAGVAPTILDVASGFDPATLPAAVSRMPPQRDTQRRYSAMVPGQLLKTLNYPSPKPVSALAELDAVLVGGATLSEEIRQRATAAGITVVRTYGMSETAGGCVYDGTPLAGVKVEADKEDRLWIAGPMIALGYRGRPGDPAFALDGWLRTDDRGSVAPDGSVTVWGRMDDALMIGGMAVWPQEVEAVLLRHSRVKDCVVVGLPDLRLGQRAVALIVVDGGAVGLDVSSADAPALPEAELSAAIQTELGRHGIPSGYFAVTSLPVLPSGKIDRRHAAHVAQAAGAEQDPGDRAHYDNISG